MADLRTSGRVHLAKVGYCNPALLCFVKYPGAKVQVKTDASEAPPLSQDVHCICLHVVACSLVRWKPHFTGEVPVPFRVACYEKIEPGFRSWSPTPVVSTKTVILQPLLNKQSPMFR